MPNHLDRIKPTGDAQFWFTVDGKMIEVDFSRTHIRIHIHPSGDTLSEEVLSEEPNPSNARDALERYLLNGGKVPG